MNCKWRINGIYKADAEIVGREIRSLGDSVTAEMILDKARDENTELHKCFEWDDSVAAEKYRINQAGGIIRNLVIQVSDDPGEERTIRVLHKANEEHVYKPVGAIVRNINEYANLLERAKMELSSFKKKYSCLAELSEIIDLIDW